MQRFSQPNINLKERSYLNQRRRVKPFCDVKSLLKMGNETHNHAESLASIKQEFTLKNIEGIIWL